ncbi:uncharacterized protein LOC128671859 [Plodia interpunctella]|uniref:uncharacterized protein LOC128671859 n=1 Tax=Plodia interpunctella TaxID=58824 RepID=UPI0023679B50|nr:uncharacterized protein LOC128671859 [Plodia interpunctella]
MTANNILKCHDDSIKNDNIFIYLSITFCYLLTLPTHFSEKICIMAQKSTQTINENKKGNQINTDKCTKEDNKAHTQVSRKKTKAGKKSRKNKANPAHRLPSGSGLTHNQVHSSSVPLPPTPYVSTMTSYYPQDFSQPIPIDWNPIVATIQVPSPMYTILPPLPVIVNPVVTTICPHTCTVFTPQIITPLAQPIVTDIPVTYTYEPTEVIYTDQLNETFVDETYFEPAGDSLEYVDQSLESQPTPDTSYVIQNIVSTNEAKDQDSKSDPLEVYLSLPRNLFPPPRMLTIDPNPIVDEFCKLKNVHSHVPWLLDLEYGIPKSPITRPIPIYNVNFNSIHCKNTPDAIHPGFDSCDEDFKSVFLFYYDCIVSSLYTGYVMLHNDASVDNFQSWLLFPMKELGMCWP